MTDQLKKFHLGMKNSLVALVPHDTLWAEAFSFIESTLKDRLLCQIELHHIGSTSIPGIAAFPREAKDYERLKLELAEASAANRGAYTIGKFDCIAGILNRALDWKDSSKAKLRL